MRIDCQDAFANNLSFILKSWWLVYISSSYSVQMLPPCAVKYSGRKMVSPNSSSAGWHMLAIVDEHLFVVMLMSVFKVTFLSQYSPLCLLCGKSKTFLTSQLAAFLMYYITSPNMLLKANEPT